MLEVTSNAKNALKVTLDKLETRPGQCVRIQTTPEGHFGLTLDAETQGDQVVKQGTNKILVVDKETASRLDGLILDVKDSQQGPEFALLRKEQQEPAGK